MNIYVFKNDQQMGPFTVEFVRSGMAGGLFASSDWSCTEGASDWVPLCHLLAHADNWVRKPSASTRGGNLGEILEGFLRNALKSPELKRGEDFASVASRRVVSYAILGLRWITSHRIASSVGALAALILLIVSTSAHHMHSVHQQEAQSADLQAVANLGIMQNVQMMEQEEEDRLRARREAAARYNLDHSSPEARADAANTRYLEQNGLPSSDTPVNTP